MKRGYESVIDEMEQVILAAKKVPFSSKVVLDADVLLQMVDRLRQETPEEILEAGWVISDKERLLAAAEEQARQVLDQARARVEEMTGETEIAAKAREQAQGIIEEAKKVAREIRVGATEYADDLLGRIERQLSETADTLRKNREELKGA